MNDCSTFDERKTPVNPICREEGRGSGQSKQAYCRAHELSPANFYRWCGKLAGGEKAKPQFAPLRLPVASPGGYVLELILATGRRVRVADGADPAWVSRLVRELEGAC